MRQREITESTVICFHSQPVRSGSLQQTSNGSTAAFFFFFFSLIFLSQALQRWVSMVSVRRRWKQEGQKCFVFFTFIKPKVTWGFRSLCASCRLIALTIRSVISTKQIHIFKTVLMVRFISFRWVTYWSLNKPPSFRDNEIIFIEVWYTGEASITGLSPIYLY